MCIFVTAVIIIYHLNILITFNFSSKTIIDLVGKLQVENLRGGRQGMHVR
jgi:hypothetical protein